MWPLSSRRSSTFWMSKLGNLASRAPKAMFSKSRKTAMVASEVLVVMAARLLHSAKGNRDGLKPIVIEADADAFGINPVRHDFMPQPTFKEHQLARRSGKCSPRARLALGGALARRCRHETIEPRIFELDPRGSRRYVYVVGAAQRRQRMQV